ncbi:MAG TPA: bifunctional nuclease family protein [Dehalococcoidales bacterium]|nr:bifunctional nuclease family protein [Dehalococcoidales bacterium]
MIVACRRMMVLDEKQGGGLDMIEMTIDSIRVSLMNYQRVVILKEKGAGRYLPIWIGPAEADAIAVKLQGVNVPRPLTHDLLRLVIDSLGASIDSIVVNDLKSDTFYAKILLNVDGGQIEIDSRPSDALALAVRAQVPIYADEAVLDKAGILLDEQTGKPVIEETEEGGGKEKKVSEEEMRKLSAFSDFINTLDMDDFDKHKS